MLSKVLLIEDSEALAETVYDYLQKTGYSVSIANSAVNATKALSFENYDICLLDLDLPDNSGFGLLISIQQSHKNMPIIIISGHNNEDEKVVGLELGAVDFITKPFSLRELQARIRVALRQKVTGSFSPTEKKNEKIKAVSKLDFFGFDFDLINRTIQKNDDVFAELTANEAKTLYLLIKAEGTPLSREDLLSQKSSGKSLSNQRSVDIAIARIRQKIAPFLEGKIIDTVHGKGYRLKQERKPFMKDDTLEI